MAQSENNHLLPTPKFTDPARILIVISPYYSDVAGELLEGAKRAIHTAGGIHDIINVPGALEIPPAIRIATAARFYDGYVALGCIVRGETTHYETVCNESARGLMDLGLEGLCVGNGILTVENMDQANARADHSGQNKGGGAADAAMHLVAIKRRFTKTGSGRIAPSSEHIHMAGTPLNKPGAA